MIDDLTFIEKLAIRYKQQQLDLDSVTPQDLLMLQCHFLKRKLYEYAKQIGQFAHKRAPFTGKLPLEYKEDTGSGLPASQQASVMPHTTLAHPDE